MEAEAERERLEERRTFHQYGIDACNKRFQTLLTSETLGLAGRIDCLIELTRVSAEEAAAGVRPPNWNDREPLFAPVEYKWTHSADQRQNNLQLAAYAIILEELTNSVVPFGFIVLLPEERAVRVSLDSGIRRIVERTLVEVREGLAAPELPPPTPHQGKCQSCEFRRFCNDVW